MVAKNTAKKEFPPFKPMAYFGGNLLLGGLSYILLRQYLRFFIFVAVIFAASFIRLGALLVMILSAFDAFFISQNLKSKKIPAPNYNNALTWVAIVLWIVMIAMTFLY